MQDGRQDIIFSFAKEIKIILKRNLKKIILYGSYARGDYKKNSDIDIMVLTDLTDSDIEKIENEIFDLAFEYQLKYGIEFSVVIKNEEHFNYWLGALPFYDNVNNEGILINE